MAVTLEMDEAATKLVLQLGSDPEASLILPEQFMAAATVVAHGYATVTSSYDGLELLPTVAARAAYLETELKKVREAEASPGPRSRR